MDQTKIAELINRRQRQILVHSIIYYCLNENIIDDNTWSKWAVELEELQRKYPDIALAQPYGAAFRDFEHSTGNNLPLDDADAYNVAVRLINYRKKEQT